MELVEIIPGGAPSREIEILPEIAGGVMKFAAEMYELDGYQPSWIGYLAVDGGECLGTCAFKAPPTGGRVEIAYFTFPGNEGREVATSMAKQLVELVNLADPKLQVFAQMRPEWGASTRVLEKLQFEQTKEINHPDDGTVWEWELRKEEIQEPAVPRKSASPIPRG